MKILVKNLIKTFLYVADQANDQLATERTTEDPLEAFPKLKHFCRVVAGKRLAEMTRVKREEKNLAESEGTKARTMAPVPSPENSYSVLTGPEHFRL